MTHPFQRAIARLFPTNPAEVQMATHKALITQCKALKQTAIVVQHIQPGFVGRIHYQATDWSALCLHPSVLYPNTFVRVVGQYNATTLIVEPLLPSLSQLSTQISTQISTQAPAASPANLS